MNQTVSVVVPIYNVEKYLKRCVDSILNQSYKNLEIILVDDGSPDKSGIIADEYGKLDSRVRVIHKGNGGLSDARNFGMKYITGKYTLFVDSDDWLSLNMIDKMVDAIEFYNADVVQTAFYYSYEDYLLFDNRYYSNEVSPTVLEKEKVMSELVKNKIVKNFAWGKLYRTALIKEIPFKKGVLFEDVFWMHKVIHNVNTYVLLHQPLYYYYQRNDSIVANYTTRNLDILKGLKERHSFLETFYKELTSDSYQLILETSLIHYNLLTANRKKDKTGLHRKEIRDYIKNHYHQLKSAVENNSSLKKQLFLFSLHPFFNLGYHFIKKILRKLKIIPTPDGLEKVNYNSEGDYKKCLT